MREEDTQEANILVMKKYTFYVKDVTKTIKEEKTLIIQDLINK